MKRRTLLKGGIATAIAGIIGTTAVIVRTGGILRSPEAEGAPVRTDTVRIPDEWVFRPDVIKIPQGTTVTWINNGAQAHTVTFRQDEPINLDVELLPGEQTRRTFTRTGTFDYYCRYHVPEMVGKVIVERD